MEIFMQPKDACRLLAVNYFSFVDKPFTTEAIFDAGKFYRYNYEAMRLSDDLIDLEIEHIERILTKIEADPEDSETKRREKMLWEEILETASNSRRTGLGFTALGDTLAALNIKYGSEESLKVIEGIMKIKMKSELDCTIDLAILRGSFKGWNKELEYEEEYDIDNDRSFFYGNNDWYKFVKEEFPEQYKRMLFYGRRNVSFSTVAPTGSLSILTQTSSGIEPIFSPFYIRKKKLTKKEAQIIPHYQDENGDLWQEFKVFHPKFKEWIKWKSEIVYKNLDVLPEKDLQSYFEASPWYGATAKDIPWDMRVKTQSIIQKYITHSISSTVNLPSDVSLEEVSNIYKEAYKQGIKGITVYRDGSRDGVLTDKKQQQTTEFKRPKILPGKAVSTSVFGDKYSFFIGFKDGMPYEVFGYKGDTINEDGFIEKEDSDIFSFIGKNENSKKRIITNKVTPMQSIVTRFASGLMRHNRDIEYIVNDLNREAQTVNSFNAALARVLKPYIKNKEVRIKAKCEECGSTNLEYKEGCLSCKDCGWSKC